MTVNATLNFPITSTLPKPQPPPRPALHVTHFRKPNLTFNPQSLHLKHPTIIHHQLRLSQYQTHRNALKDNQSESPISESRQLSETGKRDWSTSILLLGLWGGLMYYVFSLAPNQTPSMDMYLVKKLLNLTGDDGYKANQVLVALWYVMGLWPVVYTMLLLPTGRSSKGKVPVWPFLVLSCFGGAYVLLPYFVLWSPPPPPVDEDEIRKWPLNFSESKLTAGITLAAGLGLFAYAALAGGDSWKEFLQYVRGSKFIHVTSLDFTLLSTFTPFWVYNDMTARKWYDKGSWLLPLSLIPFLGPSLYILLRPSLSSMPVSLSPTTQDQE